MKVHCFFEQSGTFKNAFNAIPGYTAADYDIENTFGQTDFVIDLFDEIETAYFTHDKTIFDTITPDDLIIAFFPCIYFCAYNYLYFSGCCVNYRNYSDVQIADAIIQRATKRHNFYMYLLHLYYLAISRNLKLIIENPYTQPHYLINNFPVAPSVIDLRRNLKGDKYAKPTMYFFVNCEPKLKYQTYCPRTYSLIRKTHNHDTTAGKCDLTRSAITPEYATNFIFDYIIGKPQKNKIIQQTLF